jgi:Flp pilus assembly protein TadD
MWRTSAIAGFLIYLLAFSGCANYVYDMNREADQALGTGDYGAALGAYDRAINLNPKDVEAYIGRAYVHQKFGNNREAILDYSRAVELMPNDANVYFLRGLAYSIAGDNERAVKDYQQSISLNPANSDVYFNLAEAYTALGDRGRATDNYRKAAMLGDPNAQSVLKNQGISW